LGWRRRGRNRRGDRGRRAAYWRRSSRRQSGLPAGSASWRRGVRRGSSGAAARRSGLGLRSAARCRR
jgi:hypothetical protein